MSSINFLVPLRGRDMSDVGKIMNEIKRREFIGDEDPPSFWSVSLNKVLGEVIDLDIVLHDGSNTASVGVYFHHPDSNYRLHAQCLPDLIALEEFNKTLTDGLRRVREFLKEAGITSDEGA